MWNARSFRSGIARIVTMAVAAAGSYAYGGAVTLDEIAAMRADRVSNDDIMSILEKDGVAFEITPDVIRALRLQRFSLAMIDRMRALAKSPPPAPVADPPAGGPADAAPPAAARPALDAATEAEYAAFDERLDRIIKNSNTKLVKNRSGHVTLVSDAQMAPRFVADAKKIEETLAKNFPAPIATGTDPRKAVIVLTRTRYDYENFMKALFAEYKASGVQFEGVDAEKRALETNHLMLDGMAISCLENATDDAARHQVSYGVGYHYMNQLTDGKAPISFKAGMGSYTENLLMRDPIIMLSGGYAKRDLGATSGTWKQLARRDVTGGKYTMGRVINFDIGVMQPDEYAACWSFIELLATGEDQFAKLIAELKAGKPAAESIEVLYGVNADQLLARWKQFVSAR